MTWMPEDDRYADDLALDLGDEEFDEWTLDELETSADLASIRAASSRSGAGLGPAYD